VLELRVMPWIILMNGGLNPAMLGENGEDPWPKHAKTRVIGALRLR